MRLHKYIIGGAALWMSLLSCETRESLLGEDSNLKNGTGALALTVNAKEPVETKADVSTSDFPVTITNAAGEVVKEYSAAKNLPETITLDVDDYVVEAHSPFALVKEMDKAYYAGSADLEIKNQTTTTGTVTCTRQNCRISLSYGDDFLSAFKSWEITLNDGSESVLSYSNDGTTSLVTDPADVYWYFEPNTVEKIKVHIDAVTAAGQRVSDERTYVKSDAVQKYDDDNKYFAGGDALEISLGALLDGTPTEGNLSGITFDISLWTVVYGEDEPIKIEVWDKETTPSNPDDGEGDDDGGEGNENLSLQLPADLTRKVDLSDATDDDYLKTNAVIKAVKGIKSMVVTIVPGTEGFEEALNEVNKQQQIDFINGEELVGNTNVEGLFTSLGITLSVPKEGDTSYEFPIGYFLTFMKTAGVGTQTFKITLVDMEGNSVSDSFKITLTAA